MLFTILLPTFAVFLTSTSWTIQTLDSLGYLGFMTSLALDANGYVHISYNDGCNLKYISKTSEGWQEP
ncbi:MAG: hypothetical protein ACFFCZ_15035 [Promethearchaeota archaeon]